MTAVINFCQAYPADAILISIILIILIVLIVTGKKAALKKAALYAVNIAEDEWKQSKYGLIKKAQVMTYLRVTFPVVTAVIPDKVLEAITEEAFKIAEEVWKKAKEALKEK